MIYLLLILSTALHLSASNCLINKDFISQHLTKEAPYCNSHAAKSSYLGAGMLYYSLVYTSKAKVCVCLGSGGGFVPRIMKQAQRELGLTNARTILVDGNIGDWGRPEWLSPKSFFRSQYPDVELLIDTTRNVAMEWDPTLKINYLHIDADHSAEGSMQDFLDYLPHMAPNGIITFHDTRGDLPCSATADEIRRRGYEIVNFKEFGAGVAIIHLSKGAP